MELLIFLLLAISIYYVWMKPEDEKIAFRFFMFGSTVCFVMYFISMYTSFLPFGSY